MKVGTRGALIAMVSMVIPLVGCQPSGGGSMGSNSQGLVASGLMTAQDVRHMHELARARGGAMRLDLSDPVQHRFLVARVAASGKTRRNSPEFFQMIDRMRQRDLARKDGASVTEITAPKDHILGTINRIQNSANFRVTTFATIQDGADYNFVDAVGWTEQGNQLTDYGWGEEYADGRKLAAQATGPTASTAAEFISVDSVNLVSVGADEESFYFLEPTAVPPAAPGGTLDHPRDNNADNIVTICLDRNYGDCDYPLVGQQVVKFQNKGHIIFPFEVLEIDGAANNTFIKLVELNGGPRNMTFGPLVNWLVQDPVDKRKISWDIPQANGTFNGILFQRYEDVDYFLSMRVRLKRGGPAGTWATAKISSIDQGGDVSTGGMPKAKKMQIVWSCLAKGSKIQLADGTTAKVEDIKRGTLVKSDAASGLALPVSDISIGIEQIPMIRVADSAGRDLLLTSSHPVMTPDKGIVWAEELSVGSKVLTSTGVSTLVKVSREMYSDAVYNLKLDRSKLQDNAKGSTMYANGFLVGDLAMQKAYEFKNTKDLRADVLSRLPAAWQVDYRNSLKVASR
jgi:hypothetical protein